jgi:hypothetical protein
MRRQVIVFTLSVLITIVYFSPALLGGYFLASGEAYSYHYPKRVVAGLIASESPLQLWDPYFNSGTPFMASIESGAYYPPGWLVFLLPSAIAFTVIVLMHFAFAVYFTYLYAREIGADGLSAFAAGMVYSFFGYMALHLNHGVVFMTAPWFPLLLFFLERLRQGGDYRHAIGFAFAFSLFIYAGHPQTLTYGAMVLGFAVVYYAARLAKERIARFVGLVTLGGALGVVLALPQLVATTELLLLSPRSKITYKFFTAFSFPTHMVPSLFFPFLWGKGYGGKYWGPFTDVFLMEGYVGSLVVVLAVLIVIRLWRRDAHVLFWGLVALAGFLLSLGRYLPGYEAIFHVPLLNAFRAPVRHWFEVDFALAVMFALALARFLRHEDRDYYVRAGVAVLGSVAAASVLAVTVFKEPLMEIIRGRLGVMSSGGMVDALRLTSPTIVIPLLFIAASSAWLLIVRYGGGRMRWARYGILLIVLLDALSYRSFSPHGPKLDNTDTLCDGMYAYLKGRAHEGRVAFIHDRLHPIRGSMCGLRMAGGYGQLSVALYNDLLDLDSRGVYGRWESTLKDNNALSMLGVRFIVVSPWMEPAVARIGDSGEGTGELLYRRVYADETAAVYENTRALPLAFPVRALKARAQSEGVKEFISRPPFDPSRHVLLDGGDLSGLETSPLSDGRVTVTSYAPGRVELETDFPAAGFIVIAEQYYPGWQARMDEKRAKLYQANGVLMGVAVPPGRHKVELGYRPLHIFASMGLSALALLVMTALLLRKGPQPNGNFKPQ